jgi:hypothetical protein
MIASSSGLGFLSDKRYKRPATPIILAANIKRVSHNMPRRNADNLEWMSGALCES